MLVRHIRSAWDRSPVATIVAVDRDHIGISVCCGRDHFSKKIGREIAAGRARFGVAAKIPNRYVMYDTEEAFDICELKDIISQEYEAMVERARKYYK